MNLLQISFKRVVILLITFPEIDTYETKKTKLLFDPLVANICSFLESNQEPSPPRHNTAFWVPFLEGSHRESTRSKKLLVTKGIPTRSKDATRGAPGLSK